MPKGARSNSTRLLVGVMRRVIGGDRVDAAVDDPAHHRVDVRLLAQRRVHLAVRVELQRLFERVVGQREMMRRHFAGDVEALRLAVRTARSDPRALMCAMCTRPLVRPASVTSRWTMIVSAAPGRPRQAERRRVEALVRDAVRLEATDPRSGR